MNSTVNFTLKTDIAWIRRRWVRHRFFPVKFTLQFTSLAIFFSWTEWVLKESKHTLSERMEKEKKPFPESTVNKQRIGIMLKLEAIKKTLSVQRQRRVLLMYFIPLYLWKQDHILMYFIETRQVGLVQESTNYGNATKKGRSAPTLK